MQPKSPRTLAAVALSAAAAFCSCITAASVGATAVAGTTKLPNPFTITANWSAKSLGLNDPRRLAVAPNGNLYVTDLSQRVTELSPSGKVIRRWGKPGKRPGEFHFISGDPSDPKDIQSHITVAPDGKVYVADSGNARIQVFDSRGHYIRQFGGFGNGKEQFLAPNDLVVDRAGNVYVVDDRLQNLRKFSPTGNILWTVSGTQNSDSDLEGHFHLSIIDAHGRLLLTNDDKGRVFFIDLAGHKVDAFAARADFPSFACDATVDTAGFVYVDGCGPSTQGDTRRAATEVFNPAHERIGEWLRSPLATSPRFGPRGEIFAITWDSRTRLAAGGGIVRLHIAHPRR